MPPSIVVVNHDYARFLPAAIDSALAQTEPVEVVVVDDGSTDGSGEILDAYAHRVTVVRKANGGQASAINAGVAASSGDPVVVLDADDLLAPGAAAAHTRALAGGATRSHGSLRVVDAAGRPTGERIPGRALEGGDLRERLLRRGPGAYVGAPTSGNAWSRALLEEVLPLPEGGPMVAADGYLNDAAALVGEIVALDAVVGDYRVHGSSISDGRQAPTADAVARLLAGRRQRAAFLADLARQRGESVPDDEWATVNWRVALHELLLRRLHGTGVHDGYRRALAGAARAQLPPARRLAVTVAMTAVAAAPRPLAQRIAYRAAPPRYL